MAAEIEIAAMGHAFQLAELARREEREGVFDVGRADRVVAQFVGRMVAEPQAVAGQAEIEIPLVAPVVPVLIPGQRLAGVAEELDFHLLELARTEGEIPRRDLVAEALADLAHAKGDAHAGAVQHVLEVDEDALGRFGAEENLAALVLHGPRMIDSNMRLNSRGSVSVPGVLASGPSTARCR